MKAIAKLLWYGAAVALPLFLQSTHVGAWLIPHAGTDFYLGMSFFLTAIQVGQSAAFQATLAKGVTYEIPVVSGVLLTGAGTIACLLALVPANSSTLGVPVIFIVGLMVGAGFSLENAHLLTRDNSSSYFQNMCLRNVFIFAVSVAVARLFHKPGIDTIIICGGCIHLFHTLRSAANAIRRSSSTSRSLSKAETRSLLLGIASSSIYRNDQNLVRSFAAPSAAFGLIHNSLLAAAAIQSAAGAILTTLVLPRIKHPGQLEPWSRKLDRPSFGVMAVAGAAGLGLEGALPKILCASIVLACSQWWAYRLHINQKSAYVYSVGTVAFLILSGLLSFGVSADLAYLLFAFSTSIGVQLARLMAR
ncbi:hypothetical protein ABE493_09150 [Stenotrophomonas terrae]|uniref:hypothetical protein n=1 Tax=Stenotrophomonas terrae TaxID=405446 RepID=UPI0032084085